MLTKRNSYVLNWEEIQRNLDYGMAAKISIQLKSQMVKKALISA